MQIQATHQVSTIVKMPSATAMPLTQHGVSERGLYFACSCMSCWQFWGACGTHTCFWLCHSPRLCHAALILWQSPAQRNPKSRCVTKLSLHWHACPKLSNTAVCSHSLDRQLPPLWLLCVILGISKLNYPSDILHFKSNTASFPGKTSEWFFSHWEWLFAVELWSEENFFHTYWNLIKQLIVFRLPKSLLCLLIYGTRFSEVHPYLCTIVVC